jgi:hypothetical protein
MLSKTSLRKCHTFSRQPYERKLPYIQQYLWQGNFRSQCTVTTLVTTQNYSYFTTGGLPPIIRLGAKPLETNDQQFSFQLIPCGHSLYVTYSLTRGWICRLQLLLVLASAVILGSEPSGTHDHILLPQIRNFPNLEGQVPVFISPRNRVAQLYSQALGSLFVAS